MHMMNRVAGDEHLYPFCFHTFPPLHNTLPSLHFATDMAWPARPQDTYGLEKLYAEEMCLAYAKDFPIKTRIARYHNVYGPRGTWKGGREKVCSAYTVCEGLWR